MLDTLLLLEDGVEDFGGAAEDVAVEEEGALLRLVELLWLEDEVVLLGGETLSLLLEGVLDVGDSVEMLLVEGVSDEIDSDELEVEAGVLAHPGMKAVKQAHSAIATNKDKSRVLIKKPLSFGSDSSSTK